MTLLQFNGEGPADLPTVLRPAGRSVRWSCAGARVEIDGLTPRGWVRLVGGEGSGVVFGDATWIRCRIGPGLASLRLET